ncbi:PREDICTED: disease resistance protein RPS6-like [Nelumbo nucifera]|uniref:Disease resistance protein RPS6-like n=1 Tax=Nelumbo nucifera TaxID=4432 RepID=A0A1U8AL96_NELNU|nr:PREDICTED: disease resistance protein RPS6-like [Nelumbo nucifera]
MSSCIPNSTSYHCTKPFEGTTKVKGLILDDTHRPTDADIDTKAFRKLRKLQLLQLNYVDLRRGYEYLPRELIWLCWHGFPLEFIPTNFHPKDLVVLEMQYSKIKHVWKRIKVLKNLKVLNHSHSHNLTNTPDISGFPNLERLILKGCIGLVEVHHSIGLLDKLVLLNLEDCRNLRNLPISICKLKSLKDLNLSGCPNIGKFPFQSPFSSLWHWVSRRESPASISQLLTSSYMCSLTRLDLSHLNMSEGAILNDLRSLSSLKRLYLSYNNFNNLPASISHLCQLNEIQLVNCMSLQSIQELPSSLGSLKADGCTLLERISNIGNLTSLEYLSLCRTNICSLPDNISQLSCLKWLQLDGCSRLQKLPRLPPFLMGLYLQDCTSMERLNLSNLWHIWALYLNNCKKLVETQLPEKFGGFQIGGCTNMTYTFIKSNFLNKLFQGHLNEFDISVPGSEIPTWFRYKIMGSVISFKVPAVAGRKLTGFFVCAVYNAQAGCSAFYDDAFTIVNKTKGLKCNEGRFFNSRPRIACGDHILVCYRKDVLIHPPLVTIHIGDWLESGDQVELSVACGGNGRGIKVKKCGFHLEYAPNDRGFRLPLRNC